MTRAALLSNGDYSVLVTPAGGGYSALRGYALTAWQPDPTLFSGGMVCYLRDLITQRYWSIGEQPCARNEAVGLARATANRAEHTTRCEGIEAHVEITLAAGLNGELRRIRISNTTQATRAIEFTSFAELALNTPAGYAAHPAFAKLFVQTAYDAERSALLAWRRKRSPDDVQLWLAQRLLTPAGQAAYETDRARFLGRGRSAASPAALSTTRPLSGSTGTVLDPAFCLRSTLELEPRQSVVLELQTCAAHARAELERALDAEWSAATESVKLENAIAALGLPERWRAGIELEPFDYRWEGSVQQLQVPRDARTSWGGFSAAGSEYVLSAGPSYRPTPQPWINVLANDEFGCLVSETGAGYTWAGNSRENRISSWSNDAVVDPHSEALYVRDAETGVAWSAFPGPAPAQADYHVHHGFGYSRFVSSAHDLSIDAHVFVPRRDSVRIIRVTLTNQAQRARSLAITSYAQLVLGTGAADTRGLVETRYEERRGILFATNAHRGEFSARVAFAYALSNARDARTSATGSRASFIGTDGSISAPRALSKGELDGKFGSDLDPCAALQLDFALQAGDTVELAFLLGEAGGEVAAHECIERFATIDSVDAALGEVTLFWRELFSVVQVETPVPAFDLMLNGWLAYQNLSCRMWARSAFYQSGGAFGFRDQLQDSAALLYLDRDITRRQILLHASHQFVQGDVLHWWHPPTSKGIRTRFSDDLLWLPYITAFYITSTGESALLDEVVPFLEAQQLAPDADEIFVWPELSGQAGTLYEHCCRAIDRSLTRGPHGLPLIGVGDWNDGMNRVGREGRGESVWLGFFLFDILHEFIPLCEQRGDTERADRYSEYCDQLAETLNEMGWDGEWYRRAYYDNGAPLGSKESDEGRIDALAQAWAVLSGAAPLERAQQSMAAMKEQLVSEEDGIIRLLAPAFDQTPNDPGYIKGYVPGVRENGGQYTHAAIWAVRALAQMNDRASAARLAEMLTPVAHTATPEQTEVYKGEPYVVAADVYGVAPHTGRAGWTWYTGSAGWLYRVLLESILGFTLENGRIMRLCPCIPADWPGFTLSYRLPGGTRYTFHIVQHDQPTESSAGEVVAGALVIPIDDDGSVHDVAIKLGNDVGPVYRPRAQEITAP